MKSYITAFMKALHYEINDVFSSHCSDSLDRFMLSNDKTNQGTPTRNDQTTNPNEKDQERGRDDPCDRGDDALICRFRVVLDCHHPTVLDNLSSCLRGDLDHLDPAPCALDVHLHYTLDETEYF